MSFSGSPATDTRRERARIDLATLTTFLNCPRKQHYDQQGGRDQVEQACKQENGIVHCNNAFVDLMVTIVSFVTVFEKKYSEKFVASRLVETVQEIIVFDFLTERGVQSFYRYILSTKLLRKKNGVLTLMESLNSNVIGSESLAISHLGDVGLYMATTEKLTIFIGALNDFLKVLIARA